MIRDIIAVIKNRFNAFCFIAKKKETDYKKIWNFLIKFIKKLSILLRMENNFWKGKKVLVTGGSGFIGSYVAELLIQKGAIVSITTFKGRKSNDEERNIKDFKNKITILNADLMDMQKCLEVTKGKDIVLNLAARVGGIELNSKHPSIMFKDNLLMFMNVIEASRINNVEKFLTVSSACVYPHICTIPIPEEEGFKDAPAPSNEGYGWAKRMQEFLSKSYAKEYGMKIAIVRPSNAYGPRDNFDAETSHVIPALIRRILNGENPLIVWGSGNQTRSFLYATDFARGLLEIAEKHAVSDPINLGDEREVTIKELVTILLKLCNKEKDIKVIYDTSKPEGQPRRCSDVNKAKKLLQYKTEVKLEDGLKQTIEWYKQEVQKRK